jgi:curved DNA-binding protein CbpA
MQFHPDKVTEGELSVAEEKFKAINNAYAVLIDPAERRRYDLSFSDF